MAIQRLPAKADDNEIRAFQVRMTEVGRVRLGRFDPNKGSRGAPDKLDTFRLTSADERLIRLAAEVYGGEVREYTPQRGTVKAWEVITPVSEIPVYVPRQNIEPWNEAWRPGTCVRRCDGVTEKIKNEPCVCNGDRPPADRDLCKPTVRVQLMLPEVPGLGTWRLESHGKNACEELSAPAPFIARTPVPVPAMLMLRKENRRPWNEEKNKFESLEFYVPWLHISAATPAQFAIGGDVLTQALIAGGAPVALAPPNVRMALGAAPVAEVTSAPELETRPAAEQHVSPIANSPSADTPPTSDNRTPTADTAVPPSAHPERAQILAAIEQKTTLAEMEVLRDKLKARGVDDAAVRGSWQSRYNALKLKETPADAPQSPPIGADHQAGLKAAQQRAHEARVGDTPPPAEPEPEPEPETVDAELVEPTAEDFAAQREQLLGAGATFDVDEEFGMLYAAAGPLGWTTAQTNDKIKAFCKVEKVGQATGDALHAMRMAMKNGQLR